MPRARRPTRKRATAIRRRWLIVILAVPLVLAVGRIAWWRLHDRGPRPEPAPPAAAAGPVEPAPRPTRLVAFSEGCVSAECHASLASSPKLHEPVAERACDACHEPDTGNHVFPLVVGAETLCLKCHDTGANLPVQHQAMSAEGCLACHDAHASTNSNLLNAGSVRETCARCHPNADGAVRHEPYAEGNCGACHEPHASREAGLLRGGVGSRHCAQCHAPTTEEMASAPHTHAGVEGECLACHSPHATRYKALLTTDLASTCTSCHPEVGKAAKGSLVSHDAVLKGDQCLACHKAHDSNLDKMLRDDERTVCLGCHDKAVTARDGRTIPSMAAALASAPVTHGPVSTGNCGACHSVHGSNHARLLRELNPSVLFGSFDIKNYALCFSCHSQDLVLADTPEATAFREGPINLHKKHLTYGGKARSCASCHSVHTSTQPRLIAEKAPYEGSDWLMPIDFELTPDGGRCTTSCHEPLSYSRAVPAPDLPADQEGGNP